MGGSAQPPPPLFVEGVSTKYLRIVRVKESQLKLFKMGWVNVEIVRRGEGLEGLHTSKI